MISNNLQHTYIDQGRKFYAFFMDFEQADADGKTRKGFHFFCFDQMGYAWMSLHNTSNQVLRNFSDGIFLQRPAWQADGDLYYWPLRQDKIPDENIDVAYALETVREALGLDLEILSKLGKDNDDEPNS